MDDYCLVNLESGGGKGRILASRLGDSMRVAALDFSRLPEQLAEAKSHRRLFIAGGDGTLSSLLGHPSLPPLPIVALPLGTANDLCRELGITAALRRTNWELLVSTIAEWKPRRLSIWSLTIENGTPGGKSVTIPFCNYCSFGFEGAVIEAFSAWRKRAKFKGQWINRIMYGVSALRYAGAKLTSLSVRHPGGVLSIPAGSSSVIVSNLTSYMGIGRSNVTARPDDDLLECLYTRSLADYFAMLLPFLSGTKGSARSLRGPITVTGLPHGTKIQVDGEYAGALEIADEGVTIQFVKPVEMLCPSR